MSTDRRRWLTTLGLFLATAIGGAVAYFLARRSRRGQKSAPEQASLGDLSARLRREAAAQERRIRRQPLRLRWRGLGHRRPARAPRAVPEEPPVTPALAGQGEVLEEPPPAASAPVDSQPGGVADD